MTGNRHPFLFWMPRVLALAFALFLAIFALDVLDEGLGFWRTSAALTLHLVPSLLVVAGLWIAGRWEPVGAVLFVGVALWYVFVAWGRFPPGTYLLISGPLFVIGLLFFLDWRENRDGERGEGLRRGPAA